jgi:mycotoxin biosynthesis protein UstYa
MGFTYYTASTRCARACTSTSAGTSPTGINHVYHSHLSHCQEALAKALMCQPSVEMITYNWVEHQRLPFPDFDITRKCWDFEQLLQWQLENRVESMTQERWKALRKPDDITPLPFPLLMLEAYNITREEADAYGDFPPEDHIH